MVVRPRLARLLLRSARWQAVGDVPRRGVFVGAPHTSNWDFVFAVLVLWRAGVPPKILVKKEFFHGPLAVMLRLTGALPVDRANPGGVVSALAEQAGSGPFAVVIAAEGSRSGSEYWKSGFYRLARQTGLPIVPGFVDGPTRTTGVGPSFVPTGDVKADMDRLRAFYADKRGFRPRATPAVPRLRDESSPL